MSQLSIFCKTKKKKTFELNILKKLIKITKLRIIKNFNFKFSNHNKNKSPRNCISFATVYRRVNGLQIKLSC